MVLTASLVMSAATPSTATPGAPIVPAPNIGGQWSAVFKLPLPPAHVALLPNGKILMWFLGGKNTFTYVWDPATNTSIKKVVRGVNLMCAGFVQLSDGRVLVAGGQGTATVTQGLVNTFLFDWRTNTWSHGPNMAARRWYPSVAALPNGEALIIGGGPSYPEVFKANGKLRALTSAFFKHRKRYPFVQVEPEGKVGYFGHEVQLRSLDPAAKGAWTVFGNRDALQRIYASYAMFDIGKVLVAGGGNPGSPPTATAVVVDDVAGTLTPTPTGSLNQARRQGAMTVLADGTVLYSGGQFGKAEGADLNKAVRTPELWNPQTGGWTTMAPSIKTRQYHSTALLLPDGRVYTGGGGDTNVASYSEPNGEIYSPPYLFDGTGALATRPEITSAPATVGAGGTYEVDVSSATGVSKMALVRLGAETHAVDQGQRYVPLTVTPDTGDKYQVTVPNSYGAVPQGYYMLFAIDGNGVPSISAMVQVV